MKYIFRKKNKLYIKFFQKIFFYAINTIMKLIFTIVYIRIISLRWIFDDHPLVEYPLCTTLNIKHFIFTQNQILKCQIPIYVYDISRKIYL